MRGRTNIIARPTAIVNGNIEEFVVAEGEKVDVGDFVEYSYGKQMSENFFNNEDPKLTCSIDNDRVLIMYQPYENNSNYVLDIFKYNGNSLEKVTKSTILTEVKDVSKLKIEFIRSENYFDLLYFSKIEEKKIDFYLIKILKEDNEIELSKKSFDFDLTIYDDSSYANYREIKCFFNLGFYKINENKIISVSGYTVTDRTDISIPSGLKKDDVTYIKLIELDVSDIENIELMYEKNIVIDIYIYKIFPELSKSQGCVLDKYIIIPFFQMNNVNSATYTYDYLIRIDIVEYKIEILFNEWVNNNIHGNVTKINNSSFFYFKSGRSVSEYGFFIYKNFGNEEIQVDFLNSEIYNYPASFNLSCFQIFENYIFGGCFGTVGSKGFDYYQVLKFNENLLEVIKIPNNPIEFKRYGGLSKFEMFYLDKNIFVIQGKSIIFFNIIDDELKIGEITDNVKPFDGNYKALGFAKTGGTSGQTIQVYVPKVVS